MKQERVGVVIGRFQVPDLTPGHEDLLRTVFAQNDRLVVMLGCADVPDPKNPLSFNQRREMIESAGFDVDCVLPIKDIPNNNPLWSQSVDLTLRRAFPFDEVRLFGGRDSFLPAYSGTLATVYLDVYLAPSGSDVRAKVVETIGLNTPDFRAGVIWAVKNYEL